MKLSILVRLSLSFFILIFFSYILGFKGVVFMQELQNETQAIYKGPFVFAKTSRDIHVHIQEITLLTHRVLVTKDVTQLLALETEINLTIEEIQRHQGILDKALIGEKTSYAAYLATFDDFRKSEKKFMGLSKLGAFQKAKIVYDKQYQKYEKRLLLNIIALEEHADANADSLEEEGFIYLKNSLNEFTILLIAVSLLGIIFAIFSYYHFIRPIRKFQSLIEYIAVGDTSHEIYGLHRGDEMGDIARSIALLNEHIANITAHTRKIAAGDFTAKLATLSKKDKLVQSIQIMTKNLQESSIKNNKHNWIQSGKEHLSTILRENENRDGLGDRILIVLTEYVSAEIATLYLFEGERLVLHNSYAYLTNENLVTSFALGEGIVGQVALNDKIKVVTSVPKDYIHVKSGMGKSTPDSLILIPFFFHEKLKGVMEIGFFGDVEEQVVELLESIRESLGIAYENIESRMALNTALLQEQAASEELQVQEEELRVSNEKLLEQSEILHSQKAHLEKTSRDLAKKAVELEQSSKYKSEFLANMSHELRTPLNSLLILAHSLVENDANNLSKDEVESAKVIQESGEHLLSLINDILDISKVEAGQMGLSIDKIETTEIVTVMKKRFTHMAEEKSIYFSIEIEDSFPKYFMSDRIKLGQILTNLISNALKFTTQGGTSLTLEKLDDTLCFHIKDTGIGIPQEKQNMIFEAFRQADGSTSRNFGGTGLGLSIAMSFSKLLGAKINLQSIKGEGSTFTIVLPLHQTLEQEKEKELNETLPPFTDDRESLDEEKALFLIIEDDEKFSKILYKHCKKHGNQAIVASDGETGVVLAKRYDVKGIILDYMLPGLDGHEVLQLLKADEKTKDIPVHVMSALDDLADMKALGAVGQNTKPVSSTDINRVLDSFVTNEIVDKVSIFTNHVKEHEFTNPELLEDNLEEKTILLVDDDMRNTYSLAKVFRAKKAEVLIAPNGEKALEILSSRDNVNIILMDIMMPKMDGYEATRLIRKIERYKEIPIIAVTANAMLGDKEKCLSSGANDYMSKPIDIEKLFVMIQMWLQSK